MSAYSKVSTAACCIAGLLAVGVLYQPEPAHAQFGGIAGMLMGGFHFRMGGGGGGRYGSRHSRSGGERDDSDSSGNSARNDKVLASLGAPPSSVQVAIFKSVIIPNTLGAIGTKELMEVGKVLSKEGDRDWTCMASDIAEAYKKGGDVTQRKIEEALDAAIKSEKLDVFESFVGENWADDNLRTMILNRVVVELRVVQSNVCGQPRSADSLGNKPMDELKTVIQKAAQTTYRQIFEVSEMLAANRGLARFVQRLYQTRGRLPGDPSAQVRQNADETVINESKGALAKFESAIHPDKDGYGYALHYRAERILFDCLSDNVDKMSGKTVGAIRKDIRETSNSECVPWLEREFAANDHPPRAPNVIWSATGPKEVRQQ